MSQWIYKIGASISVLPVLALPATAYAQLSEAAKKIPKPEGAPADLSKLIGGLINALLAVMGIVFVMLTVYAGYLYMTAQGDAENTEKAKKLLGQAVIGLIIIVAAYSIADFIITQLITAAKP